MIYTNLLIFISAIFLFTIQPALTTSALPLPAALTILAAALGVYWLVARRLFSRGGYSDSNDYFAIEKRLSILALLLFAAVLFVADIKYHLSLLSFGQRFPALVNVAGLALFTAFLSLMWISGRRSYSSVFGGHYSAAGFVLANIRFNVPIVLPWIALSFAFDLINLAPIGVAESFFQSFWGDLLFIGLFIILVLLLFPPLVRRLWGCTELPDGPLKERLNAFSRNQGFAADLYIWPLFEGRVLTAAVMGLVPGLRYIMLTPALIDSMTIRELEAVVAHEIGHVQKKHLLLYVLLIAGFSLLAGFLAEPMLYGLLSFDWVFAVMASEWVHPELVVALVGGIPLLLLLLVYFRYVFGYFIRNFERQADLYVFAATGSSQALISAFDRIVQASGQSPEKPNWHHFGIGERIRHLQRCEREPALIESQDRKVRRSLAAYVVILALVIVGVKEIPSEQLARDYEGKYIETVLMQKVLGIEDEAAWFKVLGDMLQSRELDDKALAAYNQALEIDPADAELRNNLAWLLLTSGDPDLRNPGWALELARSAAASAPRPHILDTLATAYWANGLVDEAIAAGKRALAQGPEQIDYYRRQLERFQTERYDRSMRLRD